MSRRLATVTLIIYIALNAVAAATAKATHTSQALRQRQQARRHYFHAVGYIHAIGKNARRTIYSPRLSVRRRWQRRLHYLQHLRAHSYAILHPPQPRPLAPAVDACLRELIQRESGWNVSATNPSSGAYGLPQALPGSKMASAGSDWATNPATQIRWMLGYVSKYGGSCAALSFQKRNGWY